MTSVADVIGFLGRHAGWAGPLMFIVCFGESFAVVSLFVPGTVLLAASGTLVAHGTLPAVPLLGGAVLGAVAGDAISYWLGRRYGGPILRIWPLSAHPERVEAGRRLFARHGALAVFIGRFFGPLRAVVPLLAGVAGLPPVRFWIANGVSALIWAPAILLPGVLLGWVLRVLTPHEAGLVAGMGGGTVLAILLGRLIYARGGRRPR